jgi:hypothetical protein
MPSNGSKRKKEDSIHRYTYIIDGEFSRTKGSLTSPPPSLRRREKEQAQSLKNKSTSSLRAKPRGLGERNDRHPHLAAGPTAKTAGSQLLVIVGQTNLSDLGCRHCRVLLSRLKDFASSEYLPSVILGKRRLSNDARRLESAWIALGW